VPGKFLLSRKLQGLARWIAERWIAERWIAEIARDRRHRKTQGIYCAKAFFVLL
jgi:hypothetical protein